ncbi:cation diffusion facilitator family transporter [Raineyella fluvialis]|uniref:Cation diffusion facilitator family transporter n=1 Tax=Raineyella fluvialis TaxID=2662261 RepID=A0A5Q2FDC8_9ACTN|nr:cation diffusion facilitator family transporter [Raineyella fluvialis]QGF23093.1 cation diffusion facilitator family transporter [Raineyella fluvialis]
MSQARRVTLVLLLNIAMIGGLVVAGLAAHSLALVSEGGDFFADSAALGLGLLAIYLRDRHKNENATTWVALINGLWLVILSVWVTVAALVRLAHGSPEVHGLPVLITSAIAALVMFSAAAILGADAGSEDLHMRSILLDTLADGAAAAVVAVVGAVIAIAHRWFWLDAAAACLVSVIVAISAVRLLTDVVKALRSGEAYVPDED